MYPFCNKFDLASSAYIINKGCVIVHITGDFFWRQNAAWQKPSARVNPLLEQAHKAIEMRNSAETADVISNEMRVKIQQNTEEAKIDPAERARRQAMEELMVVEQEFHQALGLAKAELTTLLRRQDAYTSIVDGTADYDTVLRGIYVSPEDRETFNFVDFQTYLKDNGYQGSGTTANYFEDMVAIPDSNGLYRAVLPDMVEIQDEKGFSKLLFADQVPLYEQWQADKQAHKVEKMKEYAAKQLPEVQSHIADFPSRINGIVGSYSLKRATIMLRLPNFDKEEYTKNLSTITDLAEELRSLDPTDGKAILDLLNQIIERQRENVLSLGGTANPVFDGTFRGTPNLPSFSVLDTQA